MTEEMMELDTIIHNKVYEILAENKFVKDYDDTYTDTFAEIMEKMIITHIRQWYLEDALGMAKNPEETAKWKGLMDINFKIKRPALIKACDKMLTQVARGVIQYPSENLKRYIKDGKITEDRV